MEEQNNLNGERQEQGGQAVPFSRRFWLEFKDILAGVAFPAIVMLVFGFTIIRFAATGDLNIVLLALIGGEIMTIAALVIFGRANGSAAYAKTSFNEQKRALGSTEEKVVCKTGEYALWKGVLIGGILCIPFVILQVIELCYHNTVCYFCLVNIFGWGYFPFSFLGESYQALNLIMVIMPIASHTLGYYLGKQKQLKIQRMVAEKNAGKKGRRK